MNSDFTLPDFDNSIMNVSATLSNFLGNPSKHKTLKVLEDELEKGYKNVVFICFDGLGMNPIEKNLKSGDLFVRNIRAVLTSTFPSTTTNATNTLLCDMYPAEHGWFGWSLHFDKLKRNVDIFTLKDSWTGENIPEKNFTLERGEYYFDKSLSSEYKVNTVFPSYVKTSGRSKNYTAGSETEFFDKIREITSGEGKQFVYSYYPDPDHTMHKCGVSSAEAKKVITSLQTHVKELCDEVDDLLLIITADHGQVDVKGYAEFYKDKKLLDLLEIYPYLDSRSPAFIVKEGKNQAFEDYFNSKYGADFELHKTDELISLGIFGKTEMSDKARKSLGDYIAIGTKTHKQGLLSKKSEKFKGNHSSLTEEMLVPLILICNRKTQNSI